jgi:alpha-beta hydrolase superfamily lysophospholipase
MEKIKIKNSKGENIAAVVHYPKQKTHKLAILCPGNLDSKDYTHLVKLAEALTEQGYTVVRFDPIGTWESEGDTSEYTVTQYLNDIKNVLEYMLGKANYTHVLLGGHSRGGQLSILYAARDPRISIVVGIMASSGPVIGTQRKEWEKSGVRISLRDLPNNKTGVREFRLPFSHVLDRDQYDAVGDAAKIKAPVILLAGELDTSVLPENVKEIYDNANEPKKFILLKGIDHEYRHDLSEIEVVNKEILDALP